MLPTPLKSVSPSTPEDGEPRKVVIQVEAKGSSGIINYAGYYSEEYLNELRGRRAADLWDKLRRSDSKIKMVLKAVKAPILGGHWNIQAAKNSAKTADYEKHAALVEQVLFRDLTQSWTQQVREILTFLDFGFSLFEITHKPVMGDQTFGNYSSIAKLGWRSPRTIERWNLDQKTGGLLSVTQQAYGDLQRNVNMEGRFLLVFTHDREGDNYEGVSALRPCYGAWKRKSMYQRLQAVGIEKYAVPTPKMKVPAGKEDDPAFESAKQVLEKFTSHENQYIMYPEGWDVDFASPSNFDASKIQEAISKENAEIASAFLVNFLELGQQGSGSWALSNDLSDFMLLSIQHVADDICEILNRVLVRQIVEMNFGPQAEYPQIVCAGIKDKPGKELADLLKSLADGKLLTPDSDLEANIREKYDLPKKMEAPAPAAGTPPPNTATAVPDQIPTATAVLPAPPKVELPVAASEAGAFAIQRIEVDKKVAESQAAALVLAQNVTNIPPTASQLSTETGYKIEIIPLSSMREGTLGTFKSMEGVTVFYGRLMETV